MAKVFNNPELDNIKIKDIFNIDIFVEIIKTLAKEQETQLLLIKDQNEKLIKHKDLIDKNDKNMRKSVGT